MSYERAWLETPRKAAMWLTFEPLRQKRELASDITAINLGFTGDKNKIDAALRTFD